MEYTCKCCGEKRFFFMQISVVAKQRIDLKNGPRHKAVYDIEPEQIDNLFEDTIHCGKCGEAVDMDEWVDYQD